jgi:D(-)-tartrate dehydratase
MRIVAIRERTIALATAHRNSSISFDGMTVSALAIHTDSKNDGAPVIGLAFDSIGRYAHGGLLRERFIPRLLAADPDEYSDGHGGIDPERAWAVAMRNEKLGGHGERPGAVGLLDAALFDIAAKQAGQPLWAYLAEFEGRTPDPVVDIYASGGHYRDADDIESLRKEIGAAIRRGHTRFKIKIGGLPVAEDVRRIEAVLAILEPGMSLAVDGNGTFQLNMALAYADALSSLPIAWIEEPVHPLDYEMHRAFAAKCELPIATGENLFSADDARNLLRYGGLRRDRDILQFDVSLSYGIAEYRRILADLEDADWDRRRCAPHAGHLLAFNVVAGLGLGMAETAIDESSMFGQITAAIAVDGGRATLPDHPGVGLEASPVFADVFSELLH